MDVCLLCVLCVVRERSLRRADCSSRGFLPIVVHHCVWSWNLVNEEALAHWGLLRHKQMNKKVRLANWHWNNAKENTVKKNYKIKVCNIKTNQRLSKLQPCDTALRKFSFLTLKLNTFLNINEGSSVIRKVQNCSLGFLWNFWILVSIACSFWFRKGFIFSSLSLKWITVDLIMHCH